MSLGPLMLDMECLTLTAEERELLQHPLIGGVIFFSKNYASIPQLQSLIADINKSAKRRLLFAVDQEGGRVQRFREGFSELPPLRSLGEIYDQDSQHAQQLTQRMGWLMAAEVLASGVDFSFAPVLDLDYGVSEVIGRRSFHHNHSIVISLANSYISGMQQAGMVAVGKHFPGHGAVSLDSHVAMPIDEREFADIYAKDIQPYSKLADKLSGIMPAHVVYPKVDNQPAGFSKIWLQKILRQQLGFSGIIFSDDLAMTGAKCAGGFVDRTALALEAGCDMVLVCHQRQGAIEIMDNLPPSFYAKNELLTLRISALYGQPHLTYRELPQTSMWQQAVSALECCQ